MTSEIDRIVDATEVDKEPIRPGARVGSYLVEHELGSGGFGTVFAARHTGLDKPVVLKALHSQLVTSAVAVRRFLREGRAASKIRHPHVVDVTDVGVHESVPYLVMERLEGEDLQARLQKRPRLPVSDALAIVIPLMDALARAHDAGIVHRDLKPSNVFLAKEPQGEVPKLLDFGIAKLLDAGGQGPTMTKSGGFMGTPHYASPEQARNVRSVGPATDQYSLGAVLFELVAGEPPVSGDNAFAVLAAVHAGDRKSLVDVCPEHAELGEVIDRATQTEPEDRYASMRAMGRALLPLSSRATREAWGHAFEGPEAASVAAPVADAEPAASEGAKDESAASFAETREAPAVAAPPAASPAPSSSRIWIPVAALGVLGLVGVAAAVMSAEPESSASPSVEAPPAVSPEPVESAEAVAPEDVEAASPTPEPAEALAAPEPSEEPAAAEPTEALATPENDSSPGRARPRRRGPRREAPSEERTDTQIGVGSNASPILR